MQRWTQESMTDDVNAWGRYEKLNSDVSASAKYEKLNKASFVIAVRDQGSYFELNKILHMSFVSYEVSTGCGLGKIEKYRTSSNKLSDNCKDTLDCKLIHVIIHVSTCAQPIEHGAFVVTVVCDDIK